MGFFMAIKTTLEQLEEVQSAISNIMLGQEVTHDPGRQDVETGGPLKGSPISYRPDAAFQNRILEL
jgi:hypothetical protein